MRAFWAALAATGTLGITASGAFAAVTVAGSRVSPADFERVPAAGAPPDFTSHRHHVRIDVAALLELLGIGGPATDGVASSVGATGAAGTAVVTAVVGPAIGLTVDLGVSGVTVATFVELDVLEVVGSISAEELADHPLVLEVLADPVEARP